MSDGLPDERRLRAVEQQVLTRIRRRAAIRTRVASSAAGVAILVGAVVLVHPVLSTGFGSAGGSSGSAAGGGTSAASSAGGIACHATSEARSKVTFAPLPAHADAAAVAAACAGAVSKGAYDTSGSSTAAPASELVVCRTKDGAFEVFPKDAHPTTLCRRDGLTAG
ncbi:MAG TPA: hypothetical protein VIG76_12085 [Amnibacterium sp.]|jgi:hypothetical protein|uniref:hypothetical protein n=1 Tax=Amnibacterium sp. TaxID=1872496 RepID=UPI002F931778